MNFGIQIVNAYVLVETLRCLGSNEVMFDLKMRALYSEGVKYKNKSYFFMFPRGQSDTFRSTETSEEWITLASCRLNLGDFEMFIINNDIQV
jgi:hypothetical protein